MDAMDRVETLIRYAEGLISHEEFEAEVNIDSSMWDTIQSLMPPDVSRPDHPFRSLYGNMQSLETNNYMVKPTLLAFGYRPSFVYDLVSKLIVFRFPEIHCREPLDTPACDLLAELHLEDLDGEETRDYIRLLLLAMKDDSKKVQRQKILVTFHVENARHRPRWAQEPEWPMGEKSPMCFERQKKEGDRVQYFFRDVDTGKERVIEQLY